MADRYSGDPLKPLTFQVLVLLADGARHGWSIVKELRERSESGKRILPGSFYRTLNDMVEEGLIEEAPDAADGEDERRRYMRLTALGTRRLREETERMAGWVREARSKTSVFPAQAEA